MSATPPDPDWHIKLAASVIATVLLIAAITVSWDWRPGLAACFAAGALLAGWMIRDARRHPW
jgi:hypothetical protein